jgi:PhnB protein
VNSRPRSSNRRSACCRSLSLAYPTVAEAQRAFNALTDGGRVDMPPGKTFWSACFGMVTDRLGVQWMVSLDH